MASSLRAHLRDPFTPLALVDGRGRIYFEHFWNDFAADPARSVSEEDRPLYTAAYAQPGAMRAGFEVFRAFEQDARDSPSSPSREDSDKGKTLHWGICGRDGREVLGTCGYYRGFEDNTGEIGYIIESSC